MRRRLGIVAVVCGLALFASGCAGDESGTAKEEIPIGVDIDLSGANQVQGAAYRNALNLISDEINQDGILGGRKIRLIVQDNKSVPATSLQVAKQLIENDNVAALITAGSSETTMAVVQTVETLQVPTISTASSDAIVNPSDQRKYMFKTPASTKTVTDRLVTEFKAQHIAKAGVLTIDNDFGKASEDALFAGAKAAGLDLVANERFSAEDTDLAVPLKNIVAQKPDAIFVWAPSPFAGQVARALKDTKYTGRVYYAPEAGADLFIKDAGKSGENSLMIHPTILAANQINATTTNALDQKQFFADYSQRYGSYSGYASYAADALKIVVAAIQKSKSTEHNKIRDAIESLSLDGLTGSYSFSPANHGGVSADALTVLAVRNGSWVLAQ